MKLRFSPSLLLSRKCALLIQIPRISPLGRSLSGIQFVGRDYSSVSESGTESRVENRGSTRAKENHFHFIHGRRFRQPEIRGVPRPWPPLDRLALILIDVDLIAVYALDLIQACLCACTRTQRPAASSVRVTHTFDAVWST